MVLEDVPDRARVLVERGAALDPDRLGDRDLDVVDELAVPDRLEDPVREAQREQVLDRLLAEVVVDPEDLALLEVARGSPRSAARAERRSVPNGFSTISARPAAPLAAPAGRASRPGSRTPRRDREVEDAVAGRAALRVELARAASISASSPPLVGEVGRRRSASRRRAASRPSRRACRGRTRAPPPSSARLNSRRSPPCARRRRSRSARGAGPRTASE